MKSPSPRPAVRPALLLSGLAIALNAAALGWSHIEAEQRHAELEQLRRQHQALEGRLQQARLDVADRARLLPTFQAWQQSGMIGPENRGHWTAVLHALQRENGLPALRAEFGPAPPAAGGDTLLGSTPLHLHLELHHEEELLRFLDALPGRLAALPLLRRCRLARAADALAADCHLDLITMEIPPER